VIDPRSVDTADVHKKDRLAGRLTRRGGQVAFVYHAEYLATGGPAVATTLPLTADPVVAPAGAVPPFFAGLLPEGARLTALVRRLKTSADDELSLLLAVGADTIGDVRVVPEGQVPGEPAPLARVGRWDQQDFDALSAASTAVSGASVEMSAIPGVQIKVSAQVISFPAGDGRFLLKLEPADYPHLVRNEAFFLAVARDAGLPVPEFEVVGDRRNRPGLLVRRFDRAVQEGRLIRLAQEDVCQLAGRYPADKYRFTARGAVTAVATASAYPLVDTRQAFALMALSYLIGNGDLHAKNLSVGEDADGRLRLTPTYDMLSTLPYIPGDRLALPIEGKDSSLGRRHLLGFAAAVGLPERSAASRLDRVCGAVATAASRLHEIGLDDRVEARLRATMLRRVDHLSQG
jgi:serine/threonine-protein kinase HipA